MKLTPTQYAAFYAASLRKVAQYLEMSTTSLGMLVLDRVANAGRYGELLPCHVALRQERARILRQLRTG